MKNCNICWCWLSYFEVKDGDYTECIEICVWEKFWASTLSVNYKLFLFQTESTIYLHTPVYKSNYIFIAMKNGI